MHKPRTMFLLAGVAIFTMLLAPLGSRSGARADDAGGPVAITGNFASANVVVSPEIFPVPVPVLVDASPFIVPELAGTWVPESAQIVGTITVPMFPGPGEYLIDLPIAPGARPIDLDQDEALDVGVQVFYFILASNVVGNGHLQQIEQVGGLLSIQGDVQSGGIGDGSLVVWSPDGEQGFPEAAGADGVWFTADDTIRQLEPGYTAVTFADGAATFDRSHVAIINLPELESEAPPDFSDQGILESFDSLIDTLTARYAYTELRGLDWEAIRAQYRPAVEAADAAGDMGAYLFTLQTLALSLVDAHVQAYSPDVETRIAALTKTYENLGSGIGVYVFAPSDPANPNGPGDAVQVLTVGEESPAKALGWVPGTEILTVNGLTPAQRLDEIPLVQPVGTAESAKVQKLANFFAFAPDTEITVEFRNPGDAETQSATMVTGDYAVDWTLPSRPAVDHRSIENFSVVSWLGFSHNVQATIALLELAIREQSGNPAGGIVLDLRGNGGGWIELQQIIASYFFTAADPMPQTTLEWHAFDAATGQFVSGGPAKAVVSAPVPELAYTGNLVILVDENCASSCEFLIYQLHSLGRATVIGQYGTNGAGGSVGQINLPGNIFFRFTAGQAMKVGTKEPAFEGKGIVPDIRVPVSLESELSKPGGGDPVMDAAIAYLSEKAAEAEAAAEATMIAEATMVAEQEASSTPAATPAP